MATKEPMTLAGALGWYLGAFFLLILASAALGAAWRVFVWASGVEALR